MTSSARAALRIGSRFPLISSSNASLRSHPRRVHQTQRLTMAASSAGFIVASASASAPVAIVVKQTCPYCVRAKAALTKAGIAFLELDANDYPAVRNASDKESGMRTVPQVWLGGACFGGCDDLLAGLSSGTFAARLKETAGQPPLPPSVAAVVEKVMKK